MDKKDVCLPAYVLYLGIFLILASAATVILGICLEMVSVQIAALIAAPGITLGIIGILCWKNQWIKLIGGGKFIYSTMFGKKTVYDISDITDIKENADSYTLRLGKNRVHVESSANISAEFMAILNEIIKKRKLDV